MSVESLSLPFVRSRMRTPVTAPAAVTVSDLLDVDAPALESESDSESESAASAAVPRSARSRVLLAVAASGVFFAGVGSLGMHVAMPMPGSHSMTHQMAGGTMPGAAMAPGGQAMAPATTVQMTAPAPDAGPMRPLGPGTAVAAGTSGAGTTSAGTSASSASATRTASRPTSTHSASTSRSAAATSTGSATTATATSSTASGASQAYSVQTGDDFGAIGARFGVSSQRIAALNPGVDPTQLSIGQSLRVP